MAAILGHELQPDITGGIYTTLQLAKFAKAGLCPLHMVPVVGVLVVPVEAAKLAHVALQLCLIDWVGIGCGHFVPHIGWCEVEYTKAY